jgi:hypothetical protein
MSKPKKKMKKTECGRIQDGNYGTKADSVSSMNQNP